MKQRYKSNPKLRNNDKNQLGSLDTLFIYNTKNKDKLTKTLKRKKAVKITKQDDYNERDYAIDHYYYTEDYNSINNDDYEEGENENE